LLFENFPLYIKFEFKKWRHLALLHIGVSLLPLTSLKERL
jgi:hypothetical protein